MAKKLDRSLEIAKQIVDDVDSGRSAEYGSGLVERARALVAASGATVRKSMGVSFKSILGNERKVIEKSAPVEPGFSTAGGSTVPVPPSYGFMQPDPWLRGEIGFQKPGESGIGEFADFVAPRPAGLGQGTAAQIPTYKHELMYGAAEGYEECGDVDSANAIRKAVGKTPKVDWPAGTPEHERKLAKLKSGFAGK